MTHFDIEMDTSVALIWLDNPTERVNVLTQAMLAEFSDVLDEIEQNTDIQAAVLISKKHNSFIVGADIKEFADFNDKNEVIALINEGHALFNRLETLKKPVVAAVHGACVGGGLELIMACHYRLASTHKSTKFALPEVNLGLLPGLGGTQRLPRLIGLQKGLEYILSGGNIYPKPARKLGLVDALIHAQGLRQAAVRAALGLVSGEVKPAKSKQSWTDKLLEKTPLNRIVYSKAEETVAKRTRGNYPAPPKIIETIRTGMEQGIQAGFKAEAEHFAELVMTPESKALRHLFFAKNAAEKNPYADVAKPVTTIGVLGAGLMGAGIAQVSAQNGFDVILKDQTFEYAAKGKRGIYNDVSKRVGKGLSSFERDRVLERVTPRGDYTLFRNANLTIEAVLETLELKQQVLRDVEALAPDGHVFATNTSSIPIAQIAEASARPEAVLGMHYFSPVPKMPLLEIIKTEKTADWALATAVATGLKQGKTIIVVGDKPGFYANRIIAPYVNEALLMLAEGASVDAVDDAMRDFGFPVGPLKLLDEIGFDVGVHVTKVISPIFVERGIEVSTVMDDVLAAGFKGRKNGKGFYTYEKGKTSGVNQEIYRFFASERQQFAKSVIRERLSMAMVNEALYTLQEGVIARPVDGDVGAVFGIGFPPFLGGPFFYMQQQGLTNIASRLSTLEAEQGVRFRAPALLNEYIQQGKDFY